VSLEKKYQVNLAYDELLKLDGLVNEIAQAVIDVAKKEAGYGFSIPVMNEILRKSEETGKLTWMFKNIRSCDYCDKKRAYAKHSRSSRYHRKGDDNTKYPLNYPGVKFNEGCVVFEGYGDMCQSCMKSNRVMEVMIDYVLDHDLKIQIQKNDYKATRYTLDKIRTCYNCKLEMQESQLGREATLFGDGSFPSSCPHCKAKSGFFGPNHGFTNKHVMNAAAPMINQNSTTVGGGK